MSKVGKVAIVGVEGSGKTVLMAAMGDKYESPDANGVLLQPVNRETYSYYTKEMANLQAGKWPFATESSVLELDWMLKRQTNATQKQLGELSFLDFGGEIYRRAFGDRARDELTDEDEQRKSAVERLKAHVQNADALIVLVNLSDIINGSGSDERTIEMNWLSQAILSYAFDKAKKTNVALVFTQADTYAQTIAQCGGVRGTLAKYLRVVDSNYGNRLSLFEVAAINGTIPAADGSGLPVPAPGFTSKGLEPLMGWIVETIEKKRRMRGRLLFALAGVALLGGVAATGNTLSSRYRKAESTRLAKEASSVGHYEDFWKYAKDADKRDSDLLFDMGRYYSWGHGTATNYPAAVECFRKAAEAGNAEAAFELGTIYCFGEPGVQKDYKEAIRWYKRAADNGAGKAYEEIAYCYQLLREETEETKWYKKAFDWHMARARSGDAESQEWVGFEGYELGRGVDESYEESVKWLKKATEQGVGWHSLGLVYQSHHDLDDAEKCFEKAAAPEALAKVRATKGAIRAFHEKRWEEAFALAKKAYKDNPALNNSIAGAYHSGNGVAKNDKEAFKYWEKSAGKGLAAGMFNLGLCYKEGWGCEVDLKEAEKWMAKAEKGGIPRAPAMLAEIRTAIAKEKATENARKAYDKKNYLEFMRLSKEADKSDAGIQFMLGYCYDEGLGVGKDAKKAFEWYRKAVEQGHVVAMNNLGVLYDNGLGVQEDDYKAFELFKSAAGKGNEVAQCNLARRYRYGAGCTKNLELAKKWYRKSAEQGYENAKAELAELEKGGK